MTPFQVRGARGLLDWSQTRLAEAAGLALADVERFETGSGTRVSPDVLSHIVGALEAAGVDFISENGGGAGVRLRKPGTRHDDGKRPDELDATNDD